MASTNKLEYFRGDDISLALAFTDENDAVVNITGWTIFFEVKREKDDSDSSAVISKTVTVHTSPTLGLSTVAITASDTNALLGSYHYDIQAKTNTGRILTVTSGIITFREDITRRTS
jgi:hypothetical protein